MKVYAFSALAFMAVFGLAFVTTKISTSTKQKPPFNYETAKRTDRMAFLTAEAAVISESIQKNLGKTMEMETPLINPEMRRITYVILVDPRVAAKLKIRSMKMAAYKKLCPGYVDSILGKTGIAVIQKFVASNGTGALMKISLSNRVCAMVI